MASTFDISVNDGPHQQITVGTGQYVSAAAAVPALLGIYDFPVKVKIWVENLRPDYDGFEYIIDQPGGEAQQLVERYDGVMLKLRS